MKVKRILSILLLCSLFVFAPIFFAACSKDESGEIRASGVYHMISTVGVNWTSHGGTNTMIQSENDLPYRIYVRITGNRVETFWFNKVPMAGSSYNLYRYTTVTLASSKLLPQFIVSQNEGEEPVYVENTNLGGFEAFEGGKEKGIPTTYWRSEAGLLNYPQSSVINYFATYSRTGVVDPYLSTLYFGGSVWWNNKTYLYTSNDSSTWIFTNRTNSADRIAILFTSEGLNLYPDPNEMGPANAINFSRD